MAIMLMTMVVLPAAAMAATAAVPWVTSSRLLKEDANPASQAADAVGQTDGQQLAQHLRLFQSRAEVNGQHRAVLNDVAQVARQSPQGCPAHWRQPHR